MAEQSGHLTGKTAVVTGASAGIGRATALELAGAGASLVVQARRKPRLDGLVSEIERSGGRALAVEGDAGDETGVEALVERALSWSASGKLDIVVANAGRGLAGGVLSSDAAAWEQLVRLNVLGAARLLRRSGQLMVQQKAGDIVVLGSVAGRNISPYSGFYGSTKFAVGAIAEGLRREVSPHGVRVSLVMPGTVLSEFQGVAGYTEENFGNNVARFGELLQPQAVADAILWVVSLPPHVNVSEITIRPTGQDYP
ncbi:MAG: SDR family oxidoreductase [Polyangiaceae bacterium]|jgi:NADP-dependent 3-hydroxy acid dehydrogenase YdfG